jgi:hypothetical protein
MRRAPLRPLRACFVRTYCAVVVQEHELGTTTLLCNAKRHLVFQRSHVTLHTALFTLPTSHFALHTPRFISSHLSSSRLISPHLSSSHLISSHLISSQMSSKFFSGIFISSEHCSTFLISSKLFLIHLGSSVRQKAFTVREKLFCTEKLLDTDAFTQKSFCSQKAFSHGNL